jgi:hypothetical protein
MSEGKKPYPQNREVRIPTLIGVNYRKSPDLSKRKRFGKPEKSLHACLIHPGFGFWLISVCAEKGIRLYKHARS